MRNKTRFKAGIYFSHYECFGHTSRVMAVGEVFKKRFPQGDLFFIQAGIPQPKAKIDRLGEVYSLPGSFMDRRNFREPVLGPGENAAERTQRCLNIMTREKPDLFVTEFFPLGLEECRHELIPSLIKASLQNTESWAVAGYPLLMGIDHEWRQKILKLYQKIIIFSPSREKEFIAGCFTRTPDRQRYLDFFERNSEKIIFAGYLLPEQSPVHDDGEGIHPRPPVPKGACRVTVVRGGGACFSKLIAQAIRASDVLGKEYYLTVVAGPSTTTQEWSFFTTLAAKKKINNLVLHRAVGNYEELIKNSDVCVSTSSYHTSVMLLKYQKKAVVVPVEGEGGMSFREQPARARMLKEVIGASILPIQKLTAKTLATMVQDAAVSRIVNPQVPKEWFTGRAVLDKALTGLFGR